LRSIRWHGCRWIDRALNFSASRDRWTGPCGINAVSGTACQQITESVVPCHVFMPVDSKSGGTRDTGCRDALWQPRLPTVGTPAVNRLAAVAVPGQRRSTERLGGLNAREGTAAAAGTAVVSHRHGPGVSSVSHTRPDGPVRASPAASSIDSEIAPDAAVSHSADSTRSRQRPLHQENPPVDGDFDAIHPPPIRLSRRTTRAMRTWRDLKIRPALRIWTDPKTSRDPATWPAPATWRILTTGSPARVVLESVTAEK
jgi:hypothetical protein